MAVPPLPAEALMTLLDFWLDRDRRTVTAKARAAAKAAVAANPSASFLRICYDLLAAAPPAPRVAAPPRDMAQAAEARLERVERVVGREVAAAALGALTAAVAGVSWAEIADLLACDDQAVKAVYATGYVWPTDPV
eukprot:714945-Prorocentrum_minimum.AAC.2